MIVDPKVLAENNGKAGKPTYVAVNGEVYDISKSNLWEDGEHMNRHKAGKDLSNDLHAAPHGTEVLEKFTRVGTLEIMPGEQVRPPIPAWLDALLQKYPYFKRHPHPMIVHFPMTFFITSAILLFWYYVVMPLEPLLHSIFYLHILGTLSLPFAILTGFLSWKVNYFGKTIVQITRKIVFSFVVLIFDVIVLLTLVHNLNILASPTGIQVLIPIMIFSYLPIVAFIGHQG